MISIIKLNFLKNKNLINYEKPSINIFFLNLFKISNINLNLENEHILNINFYRSI